MVDAPGTGWLMFASWALVAGYGAVFAWREMWPQAQSALWRCRALAAWGSDGPSTGGAGRRAHRRALWTAAGWAGLWIAICTAWSMLLLYTGQAIWSGLPIATALFG